MQQTIHTTQNINFLSPVTEIECSEDMITPARMNEDMMRLIRVQSLVRGFLQRRQYRIRKSHNQGTSKYFQQDEGNETLGG